MIQEIQVIQPSPLQQQPLGEPEPPGVFPAVTGSEASKHGVQAERNRIHHHKRGQGVNEQSNQ